MQQEEEEIELRVEKDPLIGRRLADRYEIVSVIGRGGMGVVYKARQLQMDRFVAVKTLHIGKSGDPLAMKRFQSEAQAVSRVRHPNTVALYDFGVTPDGQPYLVMEYLEGISMRAAMKNGPLSLARTEHIFTQVLDALNCAHEHNIVHKDLKPENIMLTSSPGKEDHVYVLDFGIAHVMEGGRQGPSDGRPTPAEIIGSPPYMSPEQCALMPVIDHRTDIYALGICIFEALAGSGVFPYKARMAMELMDCHISQKPRALREVGTHTGTYESTTQLIFKALEKKPEKRHQSCKELSEELCEALRKDARRGLQLKDRIELDRPRTAEFTDLKKEVIDELAEVDEDIALAAGNRRQYFASKGGIFANLKSMIYGDIDSQKTTGEQPKYVFHSCPHCGTETKPDLNLCLACGRSLAAKDDYSKIRAARGEFSLPKPVDKVTGAHNKITKEITARKAMQKTGRFWVRLLGPVLLSLVLIVAVFVMCGGAQLVRAFMHSGH